MANPFETMQGLIKNTQVPEEDIKKLPEFIFRRYLSGNVVGLNIAQIFNIYNQVPIYNQYKFAETFLKKNNVNFIKYPKGSKALNINDEDIKTIQKHYQVNETLAIEYINTLGSKKVKELTHKYKMFENPVEK